MKPESALNARGWVLKNFRSVATPKAAAPFPANPSHRSVDFSFAASVSPLAPEPSFGGYRISCGIPMEARRISECDKNSTGYLIAFR